MWTPDAILNTTFRLARFLRFNETVITFQRIFKHAVGICNLEERIVRLHAVESVYFDAAADGQSVI